MSERKQETIQFICPGCRNTAVLPKESIGTFMPCPSCGVSMAVDADDTPRPPGATDSTIEEVQLVRRVTFRVFRLNMFESWESLFEETAKFANTLPARSLDQHQPFRRRCDRDMCSDGLVLDGRAGLTRPQQP